MDGSVENFSGISVYDAHDVEVADGWMDFIHDGELFIVYWKYLDIQQNGQTTEVKIKSGIPAHVFEQLSQELKHKYIDSLMEK